MRMLCIEGRQHPFHTGIVSGQVYEVSAAPFCCNAGAKSVCADGSVFIRRVTLRCRYCSWVRRRYTGPVLWKATRFVPWQEPKVSLEEVRALYLAPPLREKEPSLLYHQRQLVGLIREQIRFNFNHTKRR